MPILPTPPTPTGRNPPEPAKPVILWVGQQPARWQPIGRLLSGRHGQLHPCADLAQALVLAPESAVVLVDADDPQLRTPGWTHALRRLSALRPVVAVQDRPDGPPRERWTVHGAVDSVALAPLAAQGWQALGRLLDRAWQRWTERHRWPLHGTPQTPDGPGPSGPAQRAPDPLGMADLLIAIAHDLRQPMQAIGLFTAELQRRLGGSGSERLLDHVSTSLASMESMLDSAVAMARLESPLTAPARVAFAIEDVLVRLRVNHSAQARAKRLRFGVASHEARVTSDPALLERLLSNLVANAVQYTAQGGVLVTCRLRASGLRVQVWDTGAGIAPEHQDAVFEAFYRVEAQAGQHAGVGLGLSIVRRCAALLGIRVALRSTVGRGTCFTVDIPVVGGPAVGPDPERDAPL
jgi:signal transduction histidine kinase